MAIQAQKEDYVRNAQVLRVIDANMVEFCVDLGFNMRVNMACRFNGIVLPVVCKVSGQAAKELLERELIVGQPVVLKTFRGSAADKYGSYLAEVFLPDEETSLNAQLVMRGLALPYTS